MYRTLIATAELEARLPSPDLVIVDVRYDLFHPDAWGEEEYRKSHLPGARFAHIDRDLAAPKTGTNGRHPLPAPEDCAARFGALGIDAAKQVVIYDQNSGMFAARLWWMLRWLGHEAAAVLDGGWDKWVREGRPTSVAPPAVQPATFVVRGGAATVDARAIRASIPHNALLVVDARAPERFRGDTEPLDPVAGHIPGAVNRPASMNMTTDGTFKPPAALRAEFDALLRGRPAVEVVNQCGSGITACHNVLAMEVAGLAGTRLYPGSWSEWCSDPARPVAKG